MYSQFMMHGQKNIKTQNCYMANQVLQKINFHRTRQRRQVSRLSRVPSRTRALHVPLPCCDDTRVSSFYLQPMKNSSPNYTICVSL